MSDQQSNLQEFAEEYGTTDDAREGITVGTPDDGHLYRESEISDFWHGLEERRMDPKHFEAHSLVPPGRVMIVLQPGDGLLNFSRVDEEELRPGVYLSGKDGSFTKPPAPVAVDDDYLKFAAEAALIAADEICDDERVVAVTKNDTSLILKVADEESGAQTELFSGRDHCAVTYSLEGDEFYRGFHHIRKFGTPSSIYTEATVPRLELEELDVDCRILEEALRDQDGGAARDD